MSAQALSSRAIIGEFFKALEQDTGASWIDALSMLFTSDQDGEDYKWLGQTPVMREWIGGRNAKGFRDNGIRIDNLHFEATLEVLTKDLRRDKTGQVMVRIRELAQRTNAHWASLLSALIINGESTVAYDGQFFFDTDHSEGDSGVQSNDISIDISTLPTKVHGILANPSVEEMQLTILKGIQQIFGFKDDVGEPMNENATRFAVMGPVSLMHTIEAAVTNPLIAAGASQTSMRPAMDRLTIESAINPRLPWTDKIAVFRTDGSVSPFIRQQETTVQIKAKAEGSEFEFDNDAHQYGVDAWRNVGYGYWQHACLATMI